MNEFISEHQNLLVIGFVVLFVGPILLKIFSAIFSLWLSHTLLLMVIGFVTGTQSPELAACVWAFVILRFVLRIFSSSTRNSNSSSSPLAQDEYSQMRNKGMAQYIREQQRGDRR